ncbi:EamA/RhaT family transporter [Pseudoalteromonas piscicida]|uniref:EamA/RhaT family transporter n=2 Tax=Pseudoalteromonas TaxID=53246 RepID=A0AAQ2ITH2_PSEO7|nr:MULTISPECIES: DMT family transporter [Pseudoalteromonas]KJY87115.1 multidrug transporter [Pseudoalteromonas piscicida]MDP4490708.1 DMT family transporter [Pseudoalteromonas piscicida]TMN41585.1 EamA/RhaT family transporter [Pseudoalteromonas piscicida]TMN44717.1 EamA/RhaT family transporter [Pseudoalteromonas piscicida]TMN49052.1 EamA/RhaT family transporter [Pseudoalteromonas piscicida]
MWILFTLLAAFSQAWRNAFQSKLSESASTASVTLARFILASPLAGLYLWSLYQIAPAEPLAINDDFLAFVLGASIMQIIATGLMVVLFKQNNYAIGAGLAKSEALVAAILGVLFFGSSLTLLGWFGVFIGAIAVLLLSGFSLRAFNGTTALVGLACGTSFALTSLWVREASIASGLPFPHSAAWVLLLVLVCQTVMLSMYMTIREPHSWRLLWQRRKLTVAISVSSCIGSIGWFSAMSLEHVAYVKTLGQIEVFFTLLISFLWLKAPVKKRDSMGLLLIAIAAILVMLT